MDGWRVPGDLEHGVDKLFPHPGTRLGFVDDPVEELLDGVNGGLFVLEVEIGVAAAEEIVLGVDSFVGLLDGVAEG